VGTLVDRHRCHCRLSSCTPSVSNSVRAKPPEMVALPLRVCLLAVCVRRSPFASTPHGPTYLMRQREQRRLCVVTTVPSVSPPKETQHRLLKSPHLVHFGGREIGAGVPRFGFSEKPGGSRTRITRTLFAHSSPHCYCYCYLGREAKDHTPRGGPSSRRPSFFFLPLSLFTLSSHTHTRQTPPLRWPLRKK